MDDKKSEYLPAEKAKFGLILSQPRHSWNIVASKRHRLPWLRTAKYTVHRPFTIRQCSKPTPHLCMEMEIQSEVLSS